MTSTKKSHGEIRGNPFLQEKVHDPYRASEKHGQNTRCPDCGASYQNGRWTWDKTPTASEVACPACRRIRDRYPAGELRLSGKFLAAHRDEIIARIRNVEALERKTHPLHRIIEIEDADGETVVTTTDVHLPHQIGHALTDAWSGELDTHYDTDGYFTRVSWQRND
jgi:uncharacterized protein (UPF0248 family)